MGTRMRPPNWFEWEGGGADPYPEVEHKTHAWQLSLYWSTHKNFVDGLDIQKLALFGYVGCLLANYAVQC